MTNLWPAPYSPTPVTHTQVVPGSKSLTNRAYVLAALADGPSELRGALRSRDTDLMEGALASMGVGFAHDGGVIRVTPGPLRGSRVDCGLAGTVMRFLPAVAALAEGDVRFDGDAQARQRPISTILDALRGLGVDIDGTAMPFTVHGTGAVRGGAVVIDASGSSQFVSGLLLAGARFNEGVTVTHSGASLPSTPHIEMTLAMLADAGVDVESSGHTWRVAPQSIAGRRWDIEPDLSNATPFLAAAAVTGGTVEVPGWPERTTQPGDAIRGILTAMGCRVELTDGGALRVSGPPRGQLRGVNLNMGDIGELTPTIAALATAATTPSTLTGIAHLRGHETDRLKALTEEITGLGGSCEELDDGLLIRPAALHGGLWRSYDDHRMATAGAIVGLTTPGVEVDNIGTTAKTLPGFDAMWASMVGA